MANGRLTSVDIYLVYSLRSSLKARVTTYSYTNNKNGCFLSKLINMMFGLVYLIH